MNSSTFLSNHSSRIGNGSLNRSCINSTGVMAEVVIVVVVILLVFVLVV